MDFWGPGGFLGGYQQHTRCLKTDFGIAFSPRVDNGTTIGALSYRSGGVLDGHTTPKVWTTDLRISIDDPTTLLLGIWVAHSASEPPYATLFGSTNLNSRSAHLDTEISFLLSVPEHDHSLRASLHHEVASIRKHAHRIDSNTFALPERQVSLVTKAIVGLVGTML
jgi:phosphatidylserine/phosphatidylglycerophosphate/cardiolipin synthase-like enzyme